MLLSKEQRIGAIVLFSIALAAWLIVAVCSSNPSVPSDQPTPPKKYRTWEERKDSMRLVDSIRYAQWAAEREQRYDSFRLADSLRREEWKRIRQHQYDSFRIADSLWRDSVGWIRSKTIKKDTILDLNHCDTTELKYLRGIGSYAANRIVRYREQLGGYYSPSQLTDEPLSNLHLDTILHHFTATPNDVRKIHVNTCNIDILQRHPYVRYNQAKAIYTYRRKHIRIKSIDALQALPELSEEDIRRITPYLDFEE